MGTCPRPPKLSLTAVRLFGVLCALFLSAEFAYPSDACLDAGFRSRTRPPELLQLAYRTDPVLLAEAKPVSKSEILAPRTQDLIDDLIYTMHESHGAGIAAPQVGRGTRIFIAKIDGEPIAMINPTLRIINPRTRYRLEGCLSLPGELGLVARPRKIEISYIDRFGRENTRILYGSAATVVQHEFDHLEGILFPMRQNGYPKKFGLHKFRGLDRETQAGYGRFLFSLTDYQRRELGKLSSVWNEDLSEIRLPGSLPYMFRNASGASGDNAVFRDLLEFYKIRLSYQSPKKIAQDLKGWAKSKPYHDFVLEHLAQDKLRNDKQIKEIFLTTP